MRTRTKDWRSIGLLGMGMGGVGLMAIASAAAPAPAVPPVVATQVKAGAAVYARNCQGCHGDRLQGVRGPALLGAGWLSRYAGSTHTLGDLHAKVSKTMPKNAPGTLKAQQYLDVVAFLYDRNGITLPKTGVTAATLKSPATAKAPAAATPAVAVTRAAQVKAGMAVYAKNCQGCHGETLDGGIGPALMGAGFLGKWATVGDLHTYVSKQMPLSAPGSLTAQQYLDVVAFVLDVNKVAGGDSALGAADLKMPLK